MTFYAAWHYAHAYFAIEPTIPHSLGHDTMQRYFSTLSPLRPVAHHYFRLFNACNDARYRLLPVYRPVATELVESGPAAVKGAVLSRPGCVDEVTAQVLVPARKHATKRRSLAVR